MAEEFDPTTGLESKQDAPKAIKAPKEQLPEKATIKVFFKTSSKAIPPNVEINAGGQVVIKPVKKGEKIPNIIHNKEKIIAPV